MEVRAQQQLQSLLEGEERRRRLEVEEVEERMRSRVQALVEDQDRALRGAEEYFSGVQTKLLSDQKLLKVKDQRFRSTSGSRLLISPPSGSGSDRRSWPRSRSVRAERRRSCRPLRRRTNA